LFSSYDVIDSFFKWKRSIFFLDSDRPFNCLNHSIKILLSYKEIFEKKKMLEKINFITNKNKSKNQVGKSNSQFHSYVLFVLQNVFENDSFNRNTTYRNFNFDWVRG
jgi:hypothetical protein